MLQVLMASAFTFVWICSYWSNRDLFSPAKLYLMTLCVCFLDIFLSPYRIEVCCIYLGLLLVAMVLVAYESGIAGRFGRLIRSHQSSAASFSSGRVVALIWLLTVVPVLSIIYLVTLFGGLWNYLDQLAIRALALRGLNTFSEPAINLISLLTVLYFGVGLTEKRRAGWWLCYSLHFSIAVAILSMSGSRRYFLMPLLMMFATSHYLRAEISIKRALGVLALLLAVTSVFGVLRMGRRGPNFLARELDVYELESLTYHFKYGLIPLDVILGADVIDLHYGSTFVAAVTNLVPRPLWPGKPDSAGLVITKEYLGDPWLGTGNISAGLLAESIMNFGFVIGICFSFVVLLIGMAFLLRWYSRVLSILRSSNRSINGLFELIRYLNMALAITGLITWETAIVVPPLVLNLSALWLIERLLCVRRPMSQPMGIQSTPYLPTHEGARDQLGSTYSG
jgi:oligosaccharide repeat unit polymerase